MLRLIQCLVLLVIQLDIVFHSVYSEPSLETAAAGERFQFVRVGYFCKDTKNENTFNRVVGLKDSFPKK